MTSAVIAQISGTSGARTRTTTGAARTGSGSYSGSTVGQAMVSSDTETRKLIVVTDEQTAKYISQVITNLDRPVPQVLIKVVFLEVTYRKGYDFGIEGGVNKNINNSTKGTAANAFGLSALNTAATGSVANVFGQAVSSFGSVPPGAGLYQVLGGDFQATVRAIAEAGKTEVLSRPSILVRNNEQAIFTVGQQVPLITNVRYDTFGNQINAVSYQAVGIILQVTPFITSGGMVEMILAPQISDLSEQTVAISTGVSAPVINTRSAQTVVVTPDGQTVVIGGLMENRKIETDSKIPILGDIPLLGAAFKHKVRSSTKTELLIFLTPHIVKQPTQLAAMTANERANSQIVPKAFSEEELNRFLDGLPQKDDAKPKKTPK
jgi:general secretion pathway protein D